MDKELGTPISFDQVKIKGGFWREKQTLFKEVTIDAVYDRFEETGRFEALSCDWKAGEPFKPHIFWESDVTKWIEGASYFLSRERNEELESRIDRLIEKMEKAQGEDGYLNAYFMAVEPKARFTRRTDHELYCAGHLIEGALAYAEATGKTKLLTIARKYTDLIYRVFCEEHSAAFDTPGHEEIELALVKLYDYTKEERYKKLADYFVDTRGTSPRDTTYDFTDQEHMQSHLPVRMQKAAEGHSVRALYLYAAMADLAYRNKEEKLADCCELLFRNITEKRMYLTGGVGSTHRGESFTFDYDLPDYKAYSETCASIALALFCRRMWLLEADSRYADCAELALYNTVLAGISLTGDRFYYENPLAADPERNRFNDSRPQGLKEHLPILERVKGFDCSCCPPNLLRIVGSIGDFMYSVKESTVFAHCYMEADALLSVQGKDVEIRQVTNYPNEGEVKLILRGTGIERQIERQGTEEQETEGVVTVGVEREEVEKEEVEREEVGIAEPGTKRLKLEELALRIPAWADEVEILLNGKRIDTELRKGYAYLNQVFRDQDEILLRLPMKPAVVEANPKVTELCGRVAVMSGPIVYCIEGIDHPQLNVRDLRIARQAEFEESIIQIGDNSIPVLKTMGKVRAETQALYSRMPLEEQDVGISMIPYYAWANRGVNAMTVWVLRML